MPPGSPGTCGEATMVAGEEFGVPATMPAEVRRRAVELAGRRQQRAARPGPGDRRVGPADRDAPGRLRRRWPHRRVARRRAGRAGRAALAHPGAGEGSRASPAGPRRRRPGQHILPPCCSWWSVRAAAGLPGAVACPVRTCPPAGPTPGGTGPLPPGAPADETPTAPGRTSPRPGRAPTGPAGGTPTCGAANTCGSGAPASSSVRATPGCPGCPRRRRRGARRRPGPAPRHRRRATPARVRRPHPAPDRRRRALPHRRPGRVRPPGGRLAPGRPPPRRAGRRRPAKAAGAAAPCPGNDPPRRSRRAGPRWGGPARRGCGARLDRQRRATVQTEPLDRRVWATRDDRWRCDVLGPTTRPVLTVTPSRLPTSAVAPAAAVPPVHAEATRRQDRRSPTERG